MKSVLVKQFIIIGENCGPRGLQSEKFEIIVDLTKKTIKIKAPVNDEQEKDS
jgi:hypothetical protein